MKYQFQDTRVTRGFFLLLPICGLVLVSATRCSGALLDRMGRPTPGRRVYDYAKALGSRETAVLNALLEELDGKTRSSLVVVTLPSLEGEEINDFANRLYQKWGIGKKGVDKGVLLLAVLKDRKVRIEVGYGLEGILPDAKTGRILDSAVTPLFKQGRYGDGLLGGAYAIAQVIAEDSGVRLTGASPVRVRPRQRRGSGLLGLVFLIIMIPIFIRHPFLALFLLSGMRGGGFSGGGFGGGMGGFGGGLSGGGGASRSW